MGVKSLFGHTVGGAAGAMSRITGAMGKGIAALTFDDDFQRKRREQINKKPASIQEGIARSSKGLVMVIKRNTFYKKECKIDLFSGIVFWRCRSVYEACSWCKRRWS